MICAAACPSLFNNTRCATKRNFAVITSIIEVKRNNNDRKYVVIVCQSVLMLFVY